MQNGGGPYIFSEAVRARLGTRGRRRVQQGPDYGSGNQRRFPRRRTLRDCTGPGLQGRSPVRRCDGRVPGERDEGLPTRVHLELATLEPPPPQMQQLFDAIRGNQKAMDGFAQMNAGTISPADFGVVVAAALSRANGPQLHRTKRGGASSELYALDPPDPSRSNRALPPT